MVRLEDVFRYALDQNCVSADGWPTIKKKCVPSKGKIYCQYLITDMLKNIVNI